MKDLYSNLLRLAISVGLTERDRFVDKVSELITEKMDADPQYSTHIAESILSLAESLKDELLLRQLVSRSAGKETAGQEELAAKMDELNSSIVELTKTLKEKLS